MTMQRRVVITNSILAAVLLVIGFLALNLNVTRTYLTVSAPLDHGNRASKLIGLVCVVDDNSQAAHVDYLLETLSTAGARATFFFTGTTAINNLDLIQKIANKYELGNYGFSGTLLNLADKAKISEEITFGGRLITALTQTKPRYFLPPALQFNNHTLAMADSLGYTTVLPTTREAVIDWETADLNLVLAYATYQVQAGDIVLLKPTLATRQSFAQLLATYVMQGLQVTDLQTLLH